MSEQPSSEMGEKPVDPIVSLVFEGSEVTGFEAALPSVTLQMEEGYPLGSHLRFEVEVRVANIRYEEGKGRRRGDFMRRHVLSVEEIHLVKAFFPSELDSAVTGSAAGAADLLEDEESLDAHPDAVLDEDIPVDPMYEELAKQSSPADTAQTFADLAQEVDPDDTVRSDDDLYSEELARIVEEEARRFEDMDEEERKREAEKNFLTVDELRDVFRMISPTTSTSPQWVNDTGLVTSISPQITPVTSEAWESALDEKARWYVQGLRERTS